MKMAVFQGGSLAGLLVIQHRLPVHLDEMHQHDAHHGDKVLIELTAERRQVGGENVLRDAGQDPGHDGEQIDGGGNLFRLAEGLGFLVELGQIQGTEPGDVRLEHKLGEQVPED